MKRFSLNSRSSFSFAYIIEWILKKDSFILLQSRKCSKHFSQNLFWEWKTIMFCNFLLQIGCFPQIKPFTSVIHHYVNDFFAITVKITFVMPYHWLVYFKLKRFARLEILISVANTVITEKKNPSSLMEESILFSSNFVSVSIFHKILGCLVASCTVLFSKHCFNSLLLMFSRQHVNLDYSN